MPDTPARPAAGATRSPALPSTADAVPYVPVSWLAVGAMLVAALYVLLLLILGYFANADKRPLLYGELLVLPAAAVVLSFAARRAIRNSEGTRTGTLFGLDLPAAAWWTAVVGGLGYVAYLFAVDYSIRSEAKGEVERWAGALAEGQISRAFHRTRDPGERTQYAPDDAAGLEGRYKMEYLAFRQMDLVRVAARNPGACQFAAGGLRDWKQSPAGIECTVRGVMTCPEGVFPVTVNLRGAEGGVKGEAPAGRQWQIQLPPAGYVVKEEFRLTPYGWYLAAVERDGVKFARDFVQSARNRVVRPYAYLNATKHAGDDPVFRPLSTDGGLARAAAVGAAAAVGWVPPPFFYEETARRLLRLPGGGDPPADRVMTFAAAWANEGIDPPGFRLKEAAELVELTTVTDNSVDVRVPVEIPINTTGRGVTGVARGRLLVRCDDPAVMAELKRLRAAATDPAGTATQSPEGERPRAPDWKLVSLESDLRAVPIRQPGGPGGGGPGMPED